MVHGKADTNHGAANPPPLVRIGFSEPAERPWGNPPLQESTWFLLLQHYWLGKMRELALQPAKASHVCSKAGHLPCSQVSRERDLQALQPSDT